MKTGQKAPVVPRTSIATSLLEGWVLVSVWLSLSGWILSFLGQLNRSGYLASAALGGFALLLWLRLRLPSLKPQWRCLLHAWRGRGWRPLPALFLLTFFLVVLGGVLHPPNNYDALTYRIPQILHWLAEGHVHWIPASDRLLNITPPGYGWWMAPMVLFLNSDRLFALPNFLAFAFLPGLFFQVLRHCGVGGRVAWHWMWLLSGASCLAMQAGGIGNDLLPAAYALAALALGFRAAHTGRISDFWLSGWAAALVTGVKVTAAPLALLWLVSTLPCWRLVRHHIVATLAAGIVALAISYLPTAVANTQHTGSWSGDPDNTLQVRIDSPLRGLAGNSLMIFAGCVEPPINPWVNFIKPKLRAWEEGRLARWIREGYPRFTFTTGEMASEENSGLGLGISFLAVISCIASAGGGRQWSRPARPSPDWGFWIGWASVVAFAVYLMKMGSEAAPRLAAPYYPFLLIPILRSRGQEWLSRCRWWKVMAVLAAASILPTVILTPSRPLWPAQTTLDRFAASATPSALLQRTRLVYAVYAQRPDYLAPLKSLLPAGVRTIGSVPTGNDMETSLWKPYGARRVVEVLSPSPDDPALARLHGSAIVTSQRALAERFSLTPEAFAAAIGGRIVGRSLLTQKAARGPEEWLVVALD